MECLANRAKAIRDSKIGHGASIRWLETRGPRLDRPSWLPSVPMGIPGLLARKKSLSLTQTFLCRQQTKFVEFGG